MQRVVDLELWSQPRQRVVPLDGKLVAIACRKDTGLPETVMLGLNFVPSEIDVATLELDIQAGSTSLAEFIQFCDLHALIPDVTNELSAAWFLAFVKGQALAWLHFPVGSTGRAMASAAIQWAQASQFVFLRSQGEQPLSESEVWRLWEH